VEQAHPKDHAVLPEIISKEPLGPSVRQGDSQWFTIVKWVHFALLNAEEAGITQANVEEKLHSSDPYIKRLLGVEGDFGRFAIADRSGPEQALEQRRIAICSASPVAPCPRAWTARRKQDQKARIEPVSRPQQRYALSWPCQVPVRKLMTYDGRGNIAYF
jgi:hypothetical protein